MCFNSTPVQAVTLPGEYERRRKEACGLGGDAACGEPASKSHVLQVQIQ